MPQPKIKPPVPCLHCPRPASVRKVCPRCYCRMASHVARGLTTWDELEAGGVVGPVTDPRVLRRRGSRPKPAQTPVTCRPKPVVRVQERRLPRRQPTPRHELTEAELDALIAERLSTMPGWDPGDE